jgi:DNA polymerase III delta subunit
MSEALGKLRDAAVGDGDSPDFDRFDPEPGAVDGLLGAAATPALFSPRRLAVLRNALRLRGEDLDRLASAIPTLPECACVAIVCDPEPDADYVTARRLAEIPKRLAKALGKHGEAVNCDAPEKAAGLERLEKLAEEIGIKMDRGAARLLWARSEQEFVQARAHLERLADFATEAEGITEEHVRAVVDERLQENVFRFVDCVSAGDLGQALAQLDSLLATEPDPQVAALRTILPQLSRHYRLLWQARCLLGEGVPPAAWKDLTDDPRLPREQNLAAAVARSGFLAEKYGRLAQRMACPSVARALGELSRAEAALKGMGPGASVSDILGRMVVDLCALAK